MQNVEDEMVIILDEASHVACSRDSCKLLVVSKTASHLLHININFLCYSYDPITPERVIKYPRIFVLIVMLNKSFTLTRKHTADLYVIL